MGRIRENISTRTQNEDRITQFEYNMFSHFGVYTYCDGPVLYHNAKQSMSKGCPFHEEIKLRKKVRGRRPLKYRSS